MTVRLRSLGGTGPADDGDLGCGLQRENAVGILQEHCSQDMREENNRCEMTKFARRVGETETKKGREADRDRRCKR